MNAITLATYEVVGPNGRAVTGFAAGASPKRAQDWADYLTGLAVEQADRLGRSDLAEDPHHCTYTVRARLL
jgi:hypothetical protein